MSLCFWFCQFVFFVEFGSLTTSQLMEKVRGLQNLAFQLGLDEGKLLTQSTFPRVKSDQGLISLYNITELLSGQMIRIEKNTINQGIHVLF